MRTSDFPSNDKITTLYSGTYLTVHRMVAELFIIWRFRSYAAANVGTVDSTITFTNIMDESTSTLSLPTTFILGAGSNTIKTLKLPLNYKSISITEVTPPGA